MLSLSTSLLSPMILKPSPVPPDLGILPPQQLCNFALRQPGWGNSLTQLAFDPHWSIDFNSGWRGDIFWRFNMWLLPKRIGTCLFTADMVVGCSCSISGVPFGTHWDPFADGARANKSRLKKQAVQIMTTFELYLWWLGWWWWGGAGWWWWWWWWWLCCWWWWWWSWHCK